VHVSALVPNFAPPPKKSYFCGGGIANVLGDRVKNERLQGGRWTRAPSQRSASTGVSTLNAKRRRRRILPILQMHDFSLPLFYVFLIFIKYYVIFLGTVLFREGIYHKSLASVRTSASFLTAPQVSTTIYFSQHSFQQQSPWTRT
jgi:hypothetical protein